MTKTEAIEMLNKWGVMLPSEVQEAVDMAIEALSERTGEWSERIKAEICDDICRYPYQFNENEQAELDAICAKCPLERV